MCLPGCCGLSGALPASQNNEPWPSQTSPGRGFCLPGLSLVPVWEWALGPSICRAKNGKYVLPQDQDALPSSMFRASFSTPCSPQVAHSRCKGPSRIVPAGFSLSCCVVSGDTVLGGGTLPGNSSAELFPAAHMSLRRDLSDTSLSLGKSVRRSHVHSTSTLPPAPHMSCSHARRLLFCTTDCLGSAGAARAPPVHSHHHFWSWGIQPAQCRGQRGLTQPSPFHPSTQPSIKAPPAPEGGATSPASFFSPGSLSCPGFARPTSPLSCPQLYSPRCQTLPGAEPAHQPHAKCRSLHADNHGCCSPPLLTLRGCTE